MSRERVMSTHTRFASYLLRGKAFMAAAAIAVFMLPGSASALNFVPTDSEWATWGDMCRSRYVASAAGRGSRFSDLVRRSDVETWQRTLGGSWNALHHYCAATVLFTRANAALTQMERDHLLRRVISELRYTKSRSPASDRLFADFLVLEARAYDAMGKPNEAIGSANQARMLHPDYGSPYALQAILLRQYGKLETAREVLDEAVEANVSGMSEIQYLLAIVHRDLGDLETALAYAEEAERLGYPLTRLKQKLASQVAARN